MSPASSPGFRVGRRLIGFGDFPEMVDYDLARERVERQRADLRTVEDRSFGGKLDRDGALPPQRPRLASPNVQAQSATPGQGRSSSDVEEGARNGDAARAGRRRRGLSSPDEAVGLGIDSRRSGGGYWTRGYEGEHSGLGDGIFNDRHEMHLSGVAGM